jgi:hypothetical protein
VPLCLERCLQPPEQAVEGVAELPELIVGAGNGEPLAVAVMERSGRKTRPAISQPTPRARSAMTATSATPAMFCFMSWLMVPAKDRPEAD